MAGSEGESTHPVLFEEIESGIGLITMNRPDNLNAIDLAMIDALEDLFRELAVHDTVRVVILTGAGRGFCAGADLMQVVKNADHEVFSSAEMFLHHVQEKYANVILGFRRIPQPVIAAVNGPAAGGGFAYALASDIRLSAPEALFVASFINLGLSGGEMGSSYLLPRLVGLSRASEILYSGRKVHADEAERIGLVSKVVPKENLMDEALTIAKTMVEKSRGGLALTKRVLDGNTSAQSLQAAIDLENRNQTIMAVSSEFFKQVNAFVK
jgi:enoyl-CoA hydratase/carnithine racemase